MPDNPTEAQASTAKKWAGKYDSPEALEQGYSHQFAETQKILERQRAVEEENQLLKSMVGQPPAQTQPTAARTPWDELDAVGVPRNQLQAAIRSELQAGLAPLMQGVQARGEVISEIPEFGQFEGEMLQYVSANPKLNSEYQSAFAANPKVAMKFAFREFQAARAAQVRQTAGAENKSEGQLIQSQQGKLTSDVNKGERVSQAKAVYDAYGDEKPLIHAVLGPMIPDSHFQMPGEESQGR